MLFNIRIRVKVGLANYWQIYCLFAFFDSSICVATEMSLNCSEMYDFLIFPISVLFMPKTWCRRLWKLVKFAMLLIYFLQISFTRVGRKASNEVLIWAWSIQENIVRSSIDFALANMSHCGQTNNLSPLQFQLDDVSAIRA